MQAQTILLIRTQSLREQEAKVLPRAFQAVMGAHPVIARADVSLSAKEIVALAVQAGRAVLDAEVVFHEQIAPVAGSLIALDQYVYALNHGHQQRGVSLMSNQMSMGVQSVEKDIVDAEVIEETRTGNRLNPGTALSTPTPQRSIFDRMKDTVSEDEAQPPKLEFWWEFVDAGQTDVALSMLSENPKITHDSQMKARELLQSEDPEKVVFICFAARQFEWRSWVLTIRKLFTHSDPRVRAAAVSTVGELAGPSLAPSVYPMLSDVDATVRRAAEVAHRKLDR